MSVKVPEVHPCSLRVTSGIEIEIQLAGSEKERYKLLEPVQWKPKSILTSRGTRWWTRAARLGGLQVGLEVVRIYDHNLNSQTRLDF